MNVVMVVMVKDMGLVIVMIYIEVSECAKIASLSPKSAVNVIEWVAKAYL